MTLIEILSLLAILGAGIAAEFIERKSRKWYYDRVLLRLAGFTYGVALTLVVWIAAR